MTKYLLILTFLPVLLFSCKSKKQYKSTKAYIVERRAMKDGRLKLSYVFRVDNTVITTTKLINNIAISGDSIEILFSPVNPQDNELKPR